MTFLQESALQEALKSFSILPKSEGFEGVNNLLYLTGCSPWHDFGALKCQVGQHALAFGHMQVVDDRGLFHTLSGLSWIKKLVL